MTYQAYELESLLKLNETIDTIGGYESKPTVTQSNKTQLQNFGVEVVKNTKYYYNCEGGVAFYAIAHAHILGTLLIKCINENKLAKATHIARTICNHVRHENLLVNAYLERVEFEQDELPVGMTITTLKDENDNAFVHAIEVICSLASDISRPQGLISDSTHAVRIVRALMKLHGFAFVDCELLSGIHFKAVKDMSQAIFEIFSRKNWYENDLETIQELGRSMIRHMDSEIIDCVHNVNKHKRYEW